jgi:Flp pilus assembly protein TadG
MLFLLIGGIIQFGLIFWAQNTLTQIARDTGRWAATQTDCSAAGVTAEAKAIAANSTLFGYSGKLDVTTTWTDGSGNLWDGSGTCVPEDNQQVMFVNITIGHTVPIFFPLVPGNGDLSTTAQFRMEPEPA